MILPVEKSRIRQVAAIALGGLLVAGVGRQVMRHASGNPELMVELPRAHDAGRARHGGGLPGAEPAARWAQLRLLTPSEERDRLLLELAGEWARRDPPAAWRALAAEPDGPGRAEGLALVLRTWAMTDMRRAAEHALEQRELFRGYAVAEVLTAAVGVDVGESLELTRWLLQADPAHAGSHGHALIAALARAGEFEALADFALSDGAGSRAGWLDAAFARWAEQEPERAMLRALALAGPESRQRALAAAAGGWARAAPAGLASLALSLPAGPERSVTLEAALQAWIQRDPSDAGSWLAAHAASAEFDPGFEMIAEHPRMSGAPVLAVRWAELIVSPERRSHVVRELVPEWAARDWLAARRYIETSPALLPRDRAELLVHLSRP